MPTPSNFARMKQSPVTAALSIEPLESRIAPATISVGNPNFNDTEYSDFPFVDTDSSSDPVALQVGKGELGVHDTFFLRLHAGDKVELFTPGATTTFIEVTSGNAIAFFVDGFGGNNPDKEVQANELTGLALSAGASVTVHGSVQGDIVSNLKADGTLDLNPNTLQGGLVSPSQSLTKLSVGNIGGSLIVGGNINNVSAGQIAGGIFNGTAAHGMTFDFFPNVTGGDGTISFTAAPGQAGPSIKNIQVKSIGTRIESGAGGAGANGGLITNVEVTADTDGLFLQSGPGGIGTTSKLNGGNGGAISNIFISGFTDPTSNSPEGTQIHSGDGGDAFAQTVGHGGVGGTVSNIFVGYSRLAGKIVQSADTTLDALSIIAGSGGDGQFGGAGASISAIKARVSVKTGDNVLLKAGDGGSASGGKAGAGGSITNTQVSNFIASNASPVTIQAGQGGSAAEDDHGVKLAGGASGGSITNTLLLGEQLALIAGNGSDGITGGSGGHITNFKTLVSDVVPSDLTINAGTGGNGGTGAAGAGGAIKQIAVGIADFNDLTINGGTAADGGTSTGGRGGAGGGLSAISILETPVSTTTEGNVTIRSGKGGDGATGAGAGGNIGNILFSGVNDNLQVTSGAGGSVSTSGNGGNGGSIANAQFSALGINQGASVIGSIQAGAGGNGKGLGSGGAGGGIFTINVFLDGNLTVKAGDGGDGAFGASGKGGSISRSGLFSEQGSGILDAGNAGTSGLKPGAGGSISNKTTVRANLGIEIQAGNGSHGGTGGSITNVNFSSASSTLKPGPQGDVILTAGTGSASGNLAGKGGSIAHVIGYASSTGTTAFTAGKGGGDQRGADGGSISDIEILGGGSFGSDITFAAGDAGEGTASATGANGGQVNSISIADLESGTILRSVAAGNGGSGTLKGGIGGSIREIVVLGTDIGDRFGGDYGYSTMGGIFTGLGGAGLVHGKNGSVSQIVAEGIAAIVAGRGDTPDFAESVDHITLGTLGSVGDLLKVEQGDFSDDGGDPDYGSVDLTAYNTNNLIGFYQDPTRQDANKFLFTDVNSNQVFDKGDKPLDGLVMAKVIDLKTFTATPEFYITATTSFDFNNRIS